MLRFAKYRSLRMALLSFLFVLPAHAQGADSGAANSALPASAATDSSHEKVICRGEAETGSLVRKKKTCLTKKQWEFSRSEHQRQAQEMQAQINTERGN